MLSWLRDQTAPPERRAAACTDTALTTDSPRGRVIRLRGDGGEAVLELVVYCLCSVDRLNARLLRGVGRQKREN